MSLLTFARLRDAVAGDAVALEVSNHIATRRR